MWPNKGTVVNLCRTGLIGPKIPVLGELAMEEAFKLATQMKRGSFLEGSSRDEIHSNMAGSLEAAGLELSKII